jgi:hypothetical protein
MNLASRAAHRALVGGTGLCEVRRNDGRLSQPDSRGPSRPAGQGRTLLPRPGSRLPVPNPSIGPAGRPGLRASRSSFPDPFGWK